MAYDDYGSYIPDAGVSMWDMYQAPQVMNNTSWETTDPNQGFGVPNSYGLETQPYTQPAPSNGGWIPNYAPSNAGIWGGSPAAAPMYPAPQPAPAPRQEPLRPSGGSSWSTGGSAPNVNAMGQPYDGGARNALSASGYKPPGEMPSALYDMYSKFLASPTDGLNNPMLQAVMDQGEAAAQRGVLAKGGNGSGLMPVELQKARMASAAQILPAMADIYRGGATTESGRYGIGAQANQGTGTMALDAFNQESTDQFRRGTANYGAGQDTTAQVETQGVRNALNDLRMMQLRREMGY